MPRGQWLDMVKVRFGQRDVRKMRFFLDVWYFAYHVNQSCDSDIFRAYFVRRWIELIV